MSNAIIGRVVATEKMPSTDGRFVFLSSPDLMLNLSDIVKAEHHDGSYTYGVIEHIENISDAGSILEDFIANHGNAESMEHRASVNRIFVKVICNTKNIEAPVCDGAKVTKATAEEVKYAIHMDDSGNSIVCGYTEVKQGCEKTMIPVKIDQKFLFGRSGIHFNISGWSNHFTRMRYAMFLIKAMQESFMKKENEDECEDSVAFVLFNVNGKELLAIDQNNDFSDEHDPEQVRKETIAQYECMGLTAEPIKNVHYYYPYSGTGISGSNTFMSQESVFDNIRKEKAKQFKYVYRHDKETIELMFAGTNIPEQMKSKIIDYILTGQGSFGNAEGWQEFLDAVMEKCNSGTCDSADDILCKYWREFYSIARRIIQGNEIFAEDVQKDAGETRMEDMVRHIQKNEVHVIDIAKLPDACQSYVFCSTIQCIENLLSGMYKNEEGVKPPSKIVVFIDSLDMYTSKWERGASMVLDGILDIVKEGSSSRVVLIGAEQSKCAIHESIIENSHTNVCGWENTMKVSDNGYDHIPMCYRQKLSHSKEDGFIFHHPVFNAPVLTKFPKPVYKQLT